MDRCALPQSPATLHDCVLGSCAARGHLLR
jgi:hypothetical protein